MCFIVLTGSRFGQYSYEASEYSTRHMCTDAAQCPAVIVQFRLRFVARRHFILPLDTSNEIKRLQIFLYR